MTLFHRLSFHQRIFVLVGVFVIISMSAMWFVIRPMYERQVLEERSTVVHQLQHFAIQSIDERLDHWITMTQYLSWNLQTRPSDVDVLIRQQIAFDTSIVQVIVSSPDLKDEYVATSSASPNFSIVVEPHQWHPLAKDTTVSMLWRNEPGTSRQIFGVRKEILIDSKIIFVTLYSDAKPLLNQLDRLPVGDRFIIRLDGTEGILYSNSSVSLPFQPATGQHLNVMQPVMIDNEPWRLSTAKFSSVPVLLSIAIPDELLLQPVRQLLVYSGIIIFFVTAVVAVSGWIFSRQLSQPLSDLVRDVERLKELDFSRPVSVPKLREIAAVAQTVESMRTVLERYQKINVEKIIVEEWKNKFFLSHSEDGISITDGIGRFSFMNDRFVSIVETLRSLRPIHEKHDLITHPAVETSKETFRSEISGHYTITFHQKELKIVPPANEPQYFRLHDVTIDREGEGLGSLLVLHDLTNERMIDEMKTQMMNFIVHELRNPLNSVMGFASLIMDEQDMDAGERTEYVRIIKESSKTMNHLVNRFLDVQRLESRTVEYETETVDLVAIAKAVCDSQKPQLLAKSLALTFTAEADIPKTTASPELIREAYLNLVSNAIKYGDEHRTITVELKRSESNVQFVITDHGYGISSEDQQKLFSKFFRVTSNKKAALQIGTGLGLAHVKEVARFHKGDITLESNESIGCRFTLTIPIA